MKVIVIDRQKDFIQYILDNTDWEISLLVVDAAKQIDETLRNETRITKVETFEHILENKSVYRLDYDNIELYKNIQHASDVGYRRMYDNYQMSLYDFYSSISYWNEEIDLLNPDLCLIIEPHHGTKVDRILEEICITRNIKCFNLYIHSTGMWEIYDPQKKCLIKNTCKDITVNVDGSKFYKRHDVELAFNKYGRIAGNIYKNTGYLFSDFLYLLKNLSFSQYVFHRKMTFWELCIDYIKVLRLNRYYESICTRVDYESNYIVVYLHLEPEASLQGNCDVMDSQLIEIKMLSEALPTGWNLYVKEHPDQWRLNNIPLHSHIMMIHPFRDKNFYDVINTMDNVSLISSIHQNNKKLMENARAVSTFNGTIILEAADRNKPIFVFSPKKGIYRYCKDLFKINSMDDVRNAMDKVVHGFEPDYSDMKGICCDYLYPISDEGKKLMVDTIKREISYEFGAFD